KLRATIADVCKKLVYLVSNDLVNPADKVIFERLQYKQSDIEEIQNSLKTIMRMMHDMYGRPVILLIDEYDVPLTKASEQKMIRPDYYPKMLDVIRGILSAALKSNEYLKFGVVTGCLKIAKESIFTGVNLFKAYSVLDRRFSTYFGFTESEISELFAKAELTERMELVRSWYDGYVFGNTKVFCPWDVVNYVADSVDDPETDPENYWRNTSGNEIIRTFVERTDFSVKGKFEILMNGGTITQKISDDLT
ncbi:MAG: AAA family ATPase, partial [Blautia sp.]|nr:AAA family ATPase [Blautia sp.]